MPSSFSKEPSASCTCPISFVPLIPLMLLLKFHKNLISSLGEILFTEVVDFFPFGCYGNHSDDVCIVC